MTVSGRVVRIKDGTALVKVQRPQGCEHCENVSFCKEKQTEIMAKDTLGVKVGDTVSVTIPKSPLTWLSLLYTFLVPVAIIFAAYGLFLLSPYTLILTACLITGYYLGLRKLEKKVSGAEITSFITESENSCRCCGTEVRNEEKQS